jgi:hypothetical protein
MTRRCLIACALFAGLSACDASMQVAPETQVAPPVMQAEAPVSSGAKAPAPAEPPLRPEAGHNLAILAAACWFGDVWSDAENDPVETHGTAIEMRCRDVARRVYGQDDDPRYGQVCEAASAAASDIAAKVAELAKEDADDAPRSQTLAALVQAAAGAAREGLAAKRAAATKKGAREGDHADDEGTVGALLDARLLGALLGFQGGDLGHDAHALGLLAAIDRIRAAPAMPKRLQVYAIAGVNRAVFGAAAPELSASPGHPWREGDYLPQAAAAAGHPVPDSAKASPKREAIALAGMFAGYADRLRVDLDGLAKDSRLGGVVRAVADQLGSSSRAEVTGQASRQTK